jgi:hypothetical protein
MPENQRKLVEILEKVKRGEITISDAEEKFRQWNQQYDNDKPTSFKEKQVKFALMKSVMSGSKSGGNSKSRLGPVPAPPSSSSATSRPALRPKAHSRDSGLSVGSRNSNEVDQVTSPKANVANFAPFPQQRNK